MKLTQWSAVAAAYVANQPLTDQRKKYLPALNITFYLQMH